MKGVSQGIELAVTYDMQHVNVRGRNEILPDVPVPYYVSVQRIMKAHDRVCSATSKKTFLNKFTSKNTSS